MTSRGPDNLQTGMSLQRMAREQQDGFSLIELLTVLTMVGLLTTMAAPMLRVSPTRKVSSAGKQLLYAMDNARTAAMATRRKARVTFDSEDRTYVRYLADKAGGSVEEGKKEREALQGRGVRTLPADVDFGLGSAPRLPGDTASGAITFEDERVEFDERGITMPFGVSGVIYLTHARHPDIVVAVSVSGAAAFRLWKFRNGVWQ